MKENRKALPNRPTTRHLQMSKSKKNTLRKAAKRKGAAVACLKTYMWSGADIPIKLRQRASTSLAASTSCRRACESARLSESITRQSR